MYTQLGVLTKGTIIEVNVSELGMVTAGGKVVWGRWAQVVSFSFSFFTPSRSRSCLGGDADVFVWGTDE